MLKHFLKRQVEVLVRVFLTTSTGWWERCILLRQIFPHVSPEYGVLVVNVHVNPTSETLAPFARVFGSNAVHAMNIAGCVQCIVCCIRTPSHPSSSPVTSGALRKRREEEGDDDRFAADFQQFNVKGWNQVVDELNAQLGLMQRAPDLDAHPHMGDASRPRTEGEVLPVFEVFQGLVESSKVLSITTAKGGDGESQTGDRLHAVARVWEASNR